MLSRLRAMMEIYNSNELPGIAVRCEGFGHDTEVGHRRGRLFHLRAGDRPAAAADDAVGACDAVDPGPRGAAAEHPRAGDRARRRQQLGHHLRHRRHGGGDGRDRLPEELAARAGRPAAGPAGGARRGVAVQDDRPRPRVAGAAVLLCLVEPVEPLRLHRRVHGAQRHPARADVPQGLWHRQQPVHQARARRAQARRRSRRCSPSIRR